MYTSLRTQALEFRGETEAVLSALVEDEDVHLIHTGGGMRGALSVGLAAALEAHHMRSTCRFVGTAVSVGVVNQLLIAYRSGQRLTQCYCGEYCSSRFVRKGPWSWFSGKKVSIDYFAAVLRHKLAGMQPHHKDSVIDIGVTNFETGEPLVLTPSLGNISAVMQAVKASAYLPCTGKGYVMIDGVPCTDGGLSQPLPLELALRKNPKRLLVLLATAEASCFQHYQSLLSEWLVTKTEMRNKPKVMQEALFQRRARFAETRAFIDGQLELSLNHPLRTLPPLCIVSPTKRISMTEQRQSRIIDAVGNSYQAWWETLRAVKTKKSNSRCAA